MYLKRRQEDRGIWKNTAGAEQRRVGSKVVFS
jgi:hypothetical protein